MPTRDIANKRITLWLGGVGYLAFGAAFLIDPLQTLAAAGIALSGDLAATELRAFYGGLEVALGGLLISLWNVGLAFAVNAVSYVILIAVLLRWRPGFALPVRTPMLQSIHGGAAARPFSTTAMHAICPKSNW